MSDEGDRSKDLVELGEHLSIDGVKVENGTLNDDHGLLGNGQWRNNRMEQEIKGGIEGIMLPGGVADVSPQLQQPSSQGAVVCWERFLHLRSVRVLLVENDDSTRHVVAALLRNCSYEVVEAANGIQAWKILEDLTNRVDVVLTEVVMPCLSGIALLCKIMSHQTRNNVPVIMMSCHDSMGLVFKCLSKGAVDFLVKPIRKNELKNLWQHVWRRCHSSSGSGSESGTQTQKSVKSKSAEKSNNNSGSSDDEDNDSPVANFGDGSDHGSGTQSSWTKHAAEDQVDSARMVSTPLEAPECPDSTCAQVIHPNAKPPGSNMLSMTATKEYQEQKEPPESAKLEKAMDTGMLKDSDQEPKFQVELPTEMMSMNQYSAPKLDSSHYSEQIDKTTGELVETKESGVANNLSKTPQIIDTVFDDRKELPSTEQGVKRHRGVQDTGNAMQDDRNVLRCSESSAFSRYNAALHNKVSVGDAQSLTPLENSVDKRSELRHNIQSLSGSNAPNQCSNGGSVYVDMASTSNNRLSDPKTLKNRADETPVIKTFHPTFRSTKNNCMTSSQQAMLEETHDDNVKVVGPPVSSIQELQFQPADNIQQQQVPSNNEILLIKRMAEPIPHCGSSTALGGHLEGTSGNCSVNASTSGSNYGSNGPNGCSSGANAGGLNMESDNGAGGKSGSGDGSGSGSGSGGVTGTRSGGKMDENKLVQREAVLTKFRQKRKERCFKRKENNNHYGRLG